MEDWIPLFTELIWPVVIISLVILFRKGLRQLFSSINKAIREGRSVQFGDWMKVGEKTSIKDLSDPDTLTASEVLDVSMDEVGGYEEFIDKGSEITLDRFMKRLAGSNVSRIDILCVVDQKTYSSTLLGRYISSLGIRFVVFQRNGAFDGWIDAGLLVSQLPTREQILGYDQLKSFVGVRNHSVPSDTPALDVLKTMEDRNIENIAVVDDTRFRFIANRGAVLSKLITSALVQKPSDQ